MKQRDKNTLVKQNLGFTASSGASSAQKAASTLPPTSPPSQFDQDNDVDMLCYDVEEAKVLSEGETMFETGGPSSEPIKDLANSNEPIKDLAQSSFDSTENNKSKRDRSVEKEQSFEEFEKSLFLQVRDDLQCVNCKSSSLGNHGVGGDANQFNVRLIQVKCKKCGRKMRLKDLLIKANLSQEVKAYEEKLIENKVKKPKKEQKDIISKFVKVIDNFIVKEKTELVIPDKATVVVCEPDLDGPSKQEENKEILMLKEENYKLLESISQLAILVKQNRELIAQLNSKLRESKANESFKTTKREDKTVTAQNNLNFNKESTPVSTKGKPIQVPTVGKEGKMLPKGSTNDKTRIIDSKLQVNYQEKGHGQRFFSGKGKLESQDQKSETNQTNEIAPDQKGNEETWSQVVRKHRPRKEKVKESSISNTAIKRMAVGLTKKRREPLEFVRLHIEIYDTRSIKRAKKEMQVAKLVWTLLKMIGIARWTLEYSLIGNSILEIYVKANNLNSVKETLAEKEMNLIEEFDIATKPTHAQTDDYKSLLVKRIKFLYGRARLVNLRKCILGGLPEEIVKEVTGTDLEDQEGSQQDDHTVSDREEKDNMVIDSPNGDNHHA